MLFLLLIVYLAATVSSQSLLDAAILISGIGFIFNQLKHRPKLNFNLPMKFLVFVASYFLIVLVGFYLNASPEAPIMWYLSKFDWVLHVYLLYLVAQVIEFDIIKVLKYLSIALFLPTLYSLVSYVNGKDLITNLDNTRITGLVNSSTYHAHGNSILLVLLGVLLFFTHNQLKKSWKIFIYLHLLMLTASVFLTFTRGIWLSLFITLFFFFLIEKKKLVYILIFSVLTIGVSSYYSSSFFKERIKGFVNQDSSKERKDFFLVNIQIWQEYPFFGIGYGENMRRNQEYWNRPEWNKPIGTNTSHAHNQYLNVLSTTGFFGFMAFMSIVIYFFLLNLSLLKKTKELLGELDSKVIILKACLWMQVAFYLACISDVTFEYAKLRALIVFVWSILFAMQAKPSFVLPLLNKKVSHF